MNKIITFLLTALVLASCQKNDNAFDATGTFEADEVIISSEVSGPIQSLDIHEGTAVERGQVLGWIDTTQLVLKKRQLEAQIDAILAKRPQVATQLASYRVQLQTAQRELQRAQNLYKAEAATAKQVDDARSQVDIIRRQMEAHQSSLDISSQGLVSETLPLVAQIEQVDDQLRRSLIVSPLNGIILNQYAEQYELAAPGKPLFKMADISSLELRAFINGTQLPDVAINQSVSVFVDDGKQNYRQYDGSLIWISEKAEFTPKTIQTKEERADLVYPVKIRVKNDGLLKIGMYAEVKLNNDGNGN